MGGWYRGAWERGEEGLGANKNGNPLECEDELELEGERKSPGPSYPFGQVRGRAFGA